MAFRFGNLGRPRMDVRTVKSLEERIDILQGLVRGDGGVRHPDLRRIAVQTVRACPDRGEGCELAALFHLVKANVRYTGDIHGIDTYQSPVRTLHFGGGDCDDHASLLCALASCLGFQTGFRVVSTQGKSWEHIYAIAGAPKRAPAGVVALDTTVPSSWPGWEPPNLTHRRDFFPLDTIG